MKQIDVRLHGRPDDMAEFESLLYGLANFLQTGEVSPALVEHKGRLQIVEASKFYPNQGGSQRGRKYITFEF